MMLVEENSDICAGWFDAQEIHIAIDPLPVNTISLKGNTVYNSGKTTVLIPDANPS